MIHNRRRWAELTHDERTMLIQAFFLLPVFSIFRRMGFRRMKSLCNMVSSSPDRMSKDRNGQLEIALQAARMISIAASLSVFRMSCLDKSVLLWAMLRRRDIDSYLKLGVRTDKGSFEAHAWVEMAGMVLNETEDVCRKYQAFHTPISHPAHCSRMGGRS